MKLLKTKLKKKKLFENLLFQDSLGQMIQILKGKRRSEVRRSGLRRSPHQAQSGLRLSPPQAQSGLRPSPPQPQAVARPGSHLPDRSERIFPLLIQNKWENWEEMVLNDVIKKKWQMFVGINVLHQIWALHNFHMLKVIRGKPMNIDSFAKFLTSGSRQSSFDF